MHIVVCLKQVLDPELPPRYFKIDPETNRPEDGGSDMVMDSYAENALETAIQLRDHLGDSKVTALCLGNDLSEVVLRRALAFTADQAVRVWEDDWEDQELDGQVVGHILAQTIKKLGDVDMVLTGYQASDIEEGLVGPVIAEELKIPCITLVSNLSVINNTVTAIIDGEDGIEKIEVPTPAVFTVLSSETNVPRLPKVKDIRLSRNKSIEEYEADDLDLDPQRCQPAVTLEHVYVPNRDVACEVVPGEDGAELADGLARRLAELKVL